jgi:eukaryotic-like serine/threonine-protein kinase
MPQSEWHKVEELFQAALDVPTGQRRAWLVERCGEDAELCGEVESLLAAERASAGFLPRANLARAAGALLANADRERTVERIGRYKILREAGRGGMDVVYLAEREDKQFSQRVAVKLVKRGLDTEDILRRFRNERQILASLHHPNIAQLFDGGETEDGRPYFVMEYVAGLPLLQYSEERGLSIAERLKMFRRVCAAVSHAHQNLVVHRDIKPSNILVTEDGEPKLLDFGVAKILNAGVAGETQTRAQQRVMTPEYASPEQVRGQHVTTATDVYSLGVVLFELLTGVRPYKLKDTSPEELSRVICDSEPTRPSEAIADLKNRVLNPHDRGPFCRGRSLPAPRLRDPTGARPAQPIRPQRDAPPHRRTAPRAGQLTACPLNLFVAFDRLCESAPHCGDEPWG